MNWINHRPPLEQPKSTICYSTMEDAFVKRVLFARTSKGGGRYAYYAHGPHGVTGWRSTANEARDDYDNGRYI